MDLKSKSGSGAAALRSLEQVRIVDRGPEQIDASLLCTFEQLTHLVKQGNAKLLASLLQSGRKFDLGRLDKDFQTCLHHAARYDRFEVLQVLLIGSLSLNINARGADGWTPMHTAARFSSLAFARILAQRPDLKVDAATDLGLTPLHMAAKYCSVVMVEFLLDRGASVAARDNEGRLPIVYAVKNGCPEICAILRSRQSPVQPRDTGGKTPFMASCRLGDSRMMRFLMGLVSHSAMENCRMLCEPDFKGMTPLHHAVMSGSQEAVQLLLSVSAPLDAASVAGRTPIFLACLSGNCGVARLLANAGANMNLTDNEGSSPLHVAAEKKNTDLVQLLIDCGTDAATQDSESRTALHAACQSGHLPTIRALLRPANQQPRPGISLSCRDSGMRTCLHLLAGRPQAVAGFAELASCCSRAELDAVLGLGDWRNESVLHAAVRTCNAELVQQLLLWQPDTHLLSTDDLSPAELAASLGHLDCGRLLLSGAAATASRRLANSATLLAARNGHFEFVDFLLSEHPVDVNWTDEFGCSALMLAVSGGHEAIAALLLTAGCDANLQDKSQNTALHYAAKQDSTGSCIRLLLDSGARMQENCTGEVPLDLAASSGNDSAIEVFMASDHFEKFKAFRRSSGETLFDVLVKHSPRHAMKVLDNSVLKSRCGILDKDFSVTLDFQALDPGPYDQSSRSAYYWATKTMADCLRHDLLTHPVTAVLTLHKWRKFGRYYFIVDMLLYLLFAAANTAFIVDQKPPRAQDLNPVTLCLNASSTGERRVLALQQLLVEKYIVFGMICLRFLVELAKLVSKGYRYFLNVETYFYLALIGTTAAFMWPPSYEPCMFNWACGVFSIALTWGVFLFQMQSLPYAGIYAMMFEDVVKTLLKALSVFVFLLMGFSLSFYISNRSMDPFRTFDKSFMKTFDMSLGEYEYVTYFESINGIFREYAQTVFVLFAVIVSVALVNLLVGLAVGDIETIRSNSSTKLIAIRVQLLYEMQSIFPRWLQRRLHKSTMKIYPNKRKPRNGVMSWLLTSAYEQEYVNADLKLIGSRSKLSTAFEER